MKQKLRELAQIKIHLRNEKTKYKNQKNRALKFEKLYKEEKQKKEELEKKIKKLLEEKETDKQTIEEYKRIIFHKNKNTQDKEPAHKSIFNEAKNKERTKDSYKRELPKEEEIIDTIEYGIKYCPECKTKLENIQKYERYIEDIEASFVSQNSKKEIVKEIIYSGYCSKCKKQRSHKIIPKSPVIIGENIRMFINFQFTVLRLSYSIIINFLKIIYGFNISEGEIRNIIKKEAELLLPKYERIRETITKQKGVHFDETGWLVREDTSKEVGNYAWCMTGTETEDVLYEIGISRGGGSVKKLAQNIKQNEEERRERKQEEKIIEFVGITDNYGGYTNKFELHQLCWAHPNRKLRELGESKSLDEAKKKQAEKTSKAFSKLYKQLREEIEKEKIRIQNNIPSTKEEREKLKEKLKSKLSKIIKIHKKDPKKLVTYKTTISKYIDKYFVCILIPGIPADNNKAERALRHLVLKRKMCNGSVNTDSAKVMSINYTVLLSLYWKCPKLFFSNYKRAREIIPDSGDIIIIDEQKNC